MHFVLKWDDSTKHCLHTCVVLHNKVGFDLINKEKNIYIELKTNFSTDNYDSKNSNFQKLAEHKTKTQIMKLYMLV